jgi:hypothetical protein
MWARSTSPKKVGEQSYELVLPARWKVDYVFHGSKLELYRRVGNNQTPPPAEMLAGEDEYAVELILDHRGTMSRSPYEYLVRWVGYSGEQDCRLYAICSGARYILWSQQAKNQFRTPPCWCKGHKNHRPELLVRHAPLNHCTVRVASRGRKYHVSTHVLVVIRKAT